MIYWEFIEGFKFKWEIERYKVWSIFIILVRFWRRFLILVRIISKFMVWVSIWRRFLDLVKICYRFYKIWENLEKNLGISEFLGKF